MSGNDSRIVALHSIDNTVIEAVRIALVQVLEETIFRQRYGKYTLHRGSVDIAYQRVNDDEMLANVRFNGYRFICGISGLSHHMTLLSWVKVLQNKEAGISEDRVVNFLISPQWHLFEILECAMGNDRVTLVLGKQLPEQEVILAKGSMCEIPKIVIEEGKVTLIYYFGDLLARAVELTYVLDDLAPLMFLSAKVYLANETEE